MDDKLGKPEVWDLECRVQNENGASDGGRTLQGRLGAADLWSLAHGLQPAEGGEVGNAE
jgi:hypothetical protein